MGAFIVCDCDWQRSVNPRDQILEQYWADTDDWFKNLDNERAAIAAFDLLPSLLRVLHKCKYHGRRPAENKERVEEALAMIEKFYVDLGAPVCPDWDDEEAEKAALLRIAQLRGQT